MTNSTSNPQDYTWAAGLVAMTGTFFPTKGYGRSYVSFTVKSAIHTQAVARFAKIMGLNARVYTQGERRGLKVTVTGKRLHEMLKLLWDELPMDRKKEYAAVKKMVDATAGSSPA